MKPILFNTEMVRAILAGRKSVTRRVVKPQPVMYGFLETHFDWLKVKAPYRPGDILYVRETWCENGDYELYPFETEQFWYKADSPDRDLPTPEWFRGWRPSIHMPREAARLFLRVTDVRVERLQDITEEQAVREGVYRSREYYGIAIYAFSDIWDSTLKKADLPLYGWDANPWVWVIEFERISKEDIPTEELAE